jgi:biotin synthase-like enzyme
MPHNTTTIHHENKQSITDFTNRITLRRMHNPKRTITLQPGTNTITGNIAESNTATIGDSFSLNWFGQPV